MDCDNKKNCIRFISVYVGILLIISVTTLIIDPYFHYHSPIDSESYILDSGKEYYINDGILRNFDYDAVITGSSVSMNFKTSQMDELFGVHAVKTPLSAATWHETTELMDRAFEYNPKIRLVVRGIEHKQFEMDSDRDRFEWKPDYLYNNNSLDDVNYVLNKEVLLEDTIPTIAAIITHRPKTSFDEYLRSYTEHDPDRANKTLNKYIEKRPDKMDEQVEERILNTESVYHNLVQPAVDHPDVQFYYFFTPYSILYFDYINQYGKLQNWLVAEKDLIEILIQYDNIHLFSLFDDTDLICDLNNYTDIAHFTGEINDYIMEEMASGNHRLTRENYEEYCEKEWDFYTQYDYESLFDSE